MFRAIVDINSINLADFEIGIYNAKNLKDWDRQATPRAIKIPGASPIFLYKKLRKDFTLFGQTVSTADSLKSVADNSKFAKELEKQIDADKNLINIIFGESADIRARRNSVSAIGKRAYAKIARIEGAQKNKYVRTGETIDAISAKIYDKEAKNE